MLYTMLLIHLMHVLFFYYVYGCYWMFIVPLLANFGGKLLSRLTEKMSNVIENRNLMSK